MVDNHRNFAFSSIATAPSPASSGTSLVVAAGEGARFPTPPFNATVWAVGTQPLASNAEIIRVTAVATDTFTIARAQESSSARSIIVGDQIAATITAKNFTDIEPSLTTFSNAAYTVLSTDRTVAQIGTLTATRTVTLPAANAVNAGTQLLIIDISGTPTAVNLISVVRAGSDTINAGTSAVIFVPYGALLLESDGVSKWMVVVEAVQSVAKGGTGTTNAIGAFTALSPLTARGDMIFFDGTNNIRLPKGTSGLFLKIGANDPAWATPTPADLGAGTASIALVSSSASGGLGYAVGAGGTVTQATDKTTGVTLDKVAGQITMNNAALAAGAIVTFTLTNSTIAAADMLLLQHAATGTTGAYLLNAVTSAGSATIQVRNTTAGSLGEAIVIQFCVFKSAVS